MDVNVVTLIGNLATDVDVKDVGDDKRVANFLIAVDRRTKDGGADFVRIVAWDRQAELCSQYLSKGKRVAVDGYLRSRSWEEDGKRRRDIDVFERKLRVLGSPEHEGGATQVLELLAGVVVAERAPGARRVCVQDLAGEESVDGRVRQPDRIGDRDETEHETAKQPRARDERSVP